MKIKIRTKYNFDCDFCMNEVKISEFYFYFAGTDEIMCKVCLEKRRLNDV